jgi:hypothetical protein
MDHELIHRTIISNGGKIVGGYVREWIANGEPSNTGWSDIDILVDPQHQETIKSNIVQVLDELVEAELTLTNLFRTSRYRCDCGGTQSLADLSVDSYTSELMLLCNYCSNELPSDLFNQIKNKFQDDLNLLKAN